MGSMGLGGTGSGGGNNMYMSSLNNNSSPVQQQREGNVCFVYGIPPEMKDEELNKMFSPFGPIINCTVSKGKGFGFVAYEEDDQACHAVRCMNEFPHQGKKLQVSIKVRNYNK